MEPEIRNGGPAKQQARHLKETARFSEHTTRNAPSSAHLSLATASTRKRDARHPSNANAPSASRQLHLGDPQTVQIAVLVDLDRAVALGDGEVGFRLVGARQLCNLVALLGDQADKRDEVFVGHRMGHAADLDVNGIARNAHDGNVLLNRRIGGIRDQLGHFLATAGKRDLLVEGLHGNIAAVVAFIERDVHNVSLSRLYTRASPSGKHMATANKAPLMSSPCSTAYVTRFVSILEALVETSSQ